MKKQTLRRAAALCCAALLLAGACSGCGRSFTERTAFAMGSVLTARIYAPEEQAEKLFGRITDGVNGVDRRISATNPDSPVYAANHTGSSNADAYTLNKLGDIVMVCNILNGTVDPTVGALTELWGFSSDTPRKPTDGEIQAALETVGLEKLLLDDVNGSIILSEGQKLDPGAFGKGIALDEAYLALHTATYSAVVTFGGSVLLFGAPKSGKSWTVGIRDPFKGENDSFATLSLTPDDDNYVGYLSTSGSYEKNFTENGVTYHHILSPETGYPVETDLVSVTVCAGGGLSSDALSTACFINGLNETTLRWLKSFGAEAVFVNKDKQYYITDGLKDCFTLNDDSFSPMDHEG
ncbi:MAG: FAD:protein FMN transferase [Clostridia bacterium]|nr:FAD:protein FMN transferase [Clostridia bacterium]